MTRALGRLPVALAALAALSGCSRAGQASDKGQATAAPAKPRASAAAPGAALIGSWAGANGSRCWADVIEFKAGEMTYQPAGGGADVKTVRVTYKEAGPRMVQVVPDSGAPTSYTVTDADHLTDGAGCLYERTD